MTHSFSDVTLTLNGKPFPGEAIYDQDEIPKGAVLSYTATAHMTLDGEGASRLLDVLTPRNRGASDATLARRVEYGGRKGRSAMRRLRAKGFVGILRINGERPIPCPPIKVWTRRQISTSPPTESR